MLGSKVVDKLRDHGDEVVAASPKTGVNTVTGEGLADALTGADVVVDVSNSPSFDDGPVMEFFTKSTANLVAAAKAAGVGHYVAVSIVGSDRLPQSGYLRAKVDGLVERGAPRTDVTHLGVLVPDRHAAGATAPSRSKPAATP